MPARKPTFTLADEYLTADQVAALLKRPKRWVYNAAQRREIEHYRVGRELRFDTTQLAEYMETCRVRTLD